MYYVGTILYSAQYCIPDDRPICHKSIKKSIWYTNGNGTNG